MRKTIDFYFDFGSLFSYLAHTQLADIAACYDCELMYKPVLLGGIHKATNNTPPGAVPEKGRYLLTQDLPRFLKKYRIPFNMNPHFPVNTLVLMRGCYVAQQMGCFERYVDGMFKALWVREQNLADPAVLAGVLAELDIDGQAFLAAVNETAIKEQLKADTGAAVERGLFGAPTMCVGEAMFFGQDRLDFLQEYLAELQSAPTA